eukprot:1139376-Pelagomonas_calceolata.AAC.2
MLDLASQPACSKVPSGHECLAYAHVHALAQQAPLRGPPACLVPEQSLLDELCVEFLQAFNDVLKKRFIERMFSQCMNECEPGAQRNFLSAFPAGMYARGTFLASKVFSVLLVLVELEVDQCKHMVPCYSLPRAVVGAFSDVAHSELISTMEHEVFNQGMTAHSNIQGKIIAASYDFSNVSASSFRDRGVPEIGVCLHSQRLRHAANVAGASEKLLQSFELTCCGMLQTWLMFSFPENMLRFVSRKCFQMPLGRMLPQCILHTSHLSSKLITPPGSTALRG